jgi:sulfur carrier protein
MNVIVNGEPMELADGTSLSELVRAVVGTERGVAVSIDRHLVSRSAWSEVELRCGSIVEVLVAAAGG